MFASRFRRLRVLPVLAAVGLASVGAVTTAHARSISAKPTIVLVHGAFADSSGFDGVIGRLRHDGYPVRAAPNPLKGKSRWGYPSRSGFGVSGSVDVVGQAASARVSRVTLWPRRSSWATSRLVCRSGSRLRK